MEVPLVHRGVPARGRHDGARAALDDGAGGGRMTDNGLAAPAWCRGCPRSDLRRPARGMGLVLPAAFADRDQVRVTSRCSWSGATACVNISPKRRQHFERHYCSKNPV